MKLYSFQVAPNPTRVQLYLAEKAAGGGPIDLEQVAVNLLEGEQNRPEHLARSPFGRLPVLELDDGTFLGESLAIMEYLEELYPDPPLIGTDPLERARVRELERIAELGVLTPVAVIVHATDSPLKMAPDPALAGRFRKILDKALEVLDGRLSDGRPFVAGQRPTIADCTLQAGFQFARLGRVPVVDGRASLARWDRAYRERPAVQGVLSF